MNVIKGYGFNETMAEEIIKCGKFKEFEAIVVEFNTKVAAGKINPEMILNPQGLLIHEMRERKLLPAKMLKSKPVLCSDSYKLL